MGAEVFRAGGVVRGDQMEQLSYLLDYIPAEAKGQLTLCQLAGATG